MTTVDLDPLLLRVEALEILEAVDSCVAASVRQEKALRSDMIILTLPASPPPCRRTTWSSNALNRSDPFSVSKLRKSSLWPSIMEVCEAPALRDTNVESIDPHQVHATGLAVGKDDGADLVEAVSKLHTTPALGSPMESNAESLSEVELVRFIESLRPRLGRHTYRVRPPYRRDSLMPDICGHRSLSLSGQPLEKLSSEIVILGIRSLHASVEIVTGSLRLTELYLVRAQGEIEWVQGELASMELGPEEVEERKAILEEIHAHIKNLETDKGDWEFALADAQRELADAIEIAETRPDVELSGEDSSEDLSDDEGYYSSETVTEGSGKRQEKGKEKEKEKAEA